MRDRATVDVLFYLMILRIYTCQVLVPCTRMTFLYVLCNKASRLLRSDTVCFFVITLIRFHTLTNEDTAHTQGQRDKYKYMLKHPVMCSQQLSVLLWMNNSLISKMSFRCLCFSKITHLQKSDICWLGSYIGPPRRSLEPGNKRCSSW